MAGHRKTVQYSKHKADLVWRSKSAEQNNGVYKHREFRFVNNNAWFEKIALLYTFYVAFISLC